MTDELSHLRHFYSSGITAILLIKTSTDCPGKLTIPSAPENELVYSDMALMSKQIILELFWTFFGLTKKTPNTILNKIKERYSLAGSSGRKEAG
jgi:hypothetical protein